jgi:hypothetical protein
MYPLLFVFALAVFSGDKLFFAYAFVSFILCQTHEKAICPLIYFYGLLENFEN